MSEKAPKQSVVRNDLFDNDLFDKLTFAWEHQSYVDVLRTDSQNLKARLSDVQREVEAARANHQVVKQKVVKWLDDGNKELNATETFLGSLRPCKCNWNRRFTVAKRAVSHSNQIKVLMERWSLEGGVSPPLTPTLESSYKAMPSREKYLERIMEALLGGDKLVIGLYGATDVGKTMLVKKLALAIETSGVFNGIAITTGNRHEAYLGFMQAEIAQRNGLTMDTKSALDNAKRLNMKLKSMGKVVIIIDNVKKMLDLNTVGIPWPENNDDCRIVVVSRSLDVCKEMKTQMNLEIEPLCQEEALQLFDELTKECNFSDTTKIQQARDGLLSKFLWTPGEIKRLIQPFYAKSLPVESMVAMDGSAKKTLMLGAEALNIIDTKQPQFWRWLTPSPSSSSLKVAELITILDWIWTEKEVNEEWLSPATNYGAYFVYQLTPYARGFNASPTSISVGGLTKRCYLDPLAAASKTLDEGGGTMPLPRRRKDGWLEIELGNFFNVGRSGSVINLSVSTLGDIAWFGLLVQGFELRPLE